MFKAIEAAELENILEGEGPCTIFAPDDDAFDKLPDGVVEALMESGTKDQLEKLLKAHIVEGGVIHVSDAVLVPEDPRAELRKIKDKG